MPVQPWPHALGGLRALIGIALCALLPLAVDYAGRHVPAARIHPLLLVSAGTTAATLAYLVLVRAFEWRKVVELGLRPLPRELGIGLATGALTCAAITGGTAALAAWRGTSAGEVASIDATLRAFVLSRQFAVVEEIAFRGLLLRWLLGRTTLARAVLIQAVVFGAAHFPQGGLPHVALATLMGLAFGYAFVWRHSLWTPIGIHMAWDVNALLPASTIVDDSLADAAYAWLVVVAGSLAWLMRRWAVEWGPATTMPRSP